jgi:DNA-binding response OmpR family regulator
MALVLAVDDDPHILELVTHFLKSAGHEVVAQATGHGALEAAAKQSFDLVVLDVLLPGFDGREVARRLRREGRLPILMLTALGELHHKLQGFDAGADDYLAKPFEPAELMARVKALLARGGAPAGAAPSPPSQLRVGALVLEPEALVIVAGGERHSVPAKEFALFECLARSPGRLFTREQLLAAAWGPDYAGADRTVDVYINRLRTRFPEADYGYAIVPVRGVGYRLEAAP